MGISTIPAPKNTAGTLWPRYFTGSIHVGLLIANFGHGLGKVARIGSQIHYRDSKVRSYA